MDGSRRLRCREVEDALPLEEEVALLREEQAEARQVHLLLVDLDLRKVGVHRQVERHVAGDAVFRVDADVAIDLFDTGGVDTRFVVRFDTP